MNERYNDYNIYPFYYSYVIVDFDVLAVHRKNKQSYMGRSLI